MAANATKTDWDNPDWSLRCAKCQSFAYHSLWRGEKAEEGYICPGCDMPHFHGDLNKERERLRWEVIRLEQRCKDLETALLTALAAQKES